MAPFFLNSSLRLTLKFGQITNEHLGLKMKRWPCSILLAEYVDCLTSTALLLTWSSGPPKTGKSSGNRLTAVVLFQLHDEDSWLFSTSRNTTSLVIQFRE